MTLDANSQVALIAGGAAVLGALAGSLGSVVMSLVTARNERNRERLRLAVECAAREFDFQAERWRRLNESGRLADLGPFQTFIFMSYETLKAIDRGELTAARWSELRAKADALYEAAEDKANG